MKVCPKCGDKNETTSSYCPPCHNEYQKKYFKGHPESITESHRIRRKERRDHILSKKFNKPCSDCGKIYPWYVMDFDHARGKKKFLLSLASSKMYSVAAIDAEISKCDIVCSNCHRERTHSRLQLSDGVTGNILGLEPIG